ncbi:patatin family protein [Cyclospora cayetanensis]|uniref:Patatin family protein n=1 Tax=Cyclospora cayetanensis TaxID=88456 RepID=A0A1D3D5W9_9EIME|nr:patatin family protein [Cyclospora cayetanensis]
MEVCGDLHGPRPPFNPVYILRLEQLLRHLLSNGEESGGSAASSRAALTWWLCGRREDPCAFEKGGKRLLQQCSTLLQQHVHPVSLLLYRRRLLGGGPFAEDSACKPTGEASVRGKDEALRDGSVLALAIEGGAMRGCVCAGMAVALHHMGFSDAFDVIYGSSAGALIGAFLVSRQLAYEGSCVYTDWLPYLGSRFLNLRRIGRALGLGCLLDGDVLDLFRSRLGTPLVNLDALLLEVLQKKQPFNFSQFQRNDLKQPLKVIASGLLSLKPVTLDSAGGSIKDMASLCECLRASMLLPGLTGPVVHLPLWTHPSATPESKDEPHASSWGPLARFLPIVASSCLPRFSAEAPKALVTEPLADALLFEAVPYRSAIAQGASHVLVLRSRPDKAPVTRLKGIEAAIEMRMARRFFLRKHHDLRPVYDFMRRRGHREIYMRDMLRLNAATNQINHLISGAYTASGPAGGLKRGPHDSERRAHAMAVAVGGTEKEAQKLKADRGAIIRGVRSGFAALWEALQPDPALREKGLEEALKIFPDDLAFSPALKGAPLPSPPPYTAEEASAHLTPEELAEHLLQAVAAVQVGGESLDRKSPEQPHPGETGAS